MKSYREINHQLIRDSKSKDNETKPLSYQQSFRQAFLNGSPLDIDATCLVTLNNTAR